MEQRILGRARAVTEARDADTLGIDDPARDQQMDALLERGQHASQVRPILHVVAFEFVSITTGRQQADLTRALEAEHREAVRGEQLNGIFVAGAAAEKPAAVILHDDQRMPLAWPMVRREDKIAKSLDAAIVAPGQPLDPAQPNLAELRIEIEDRTDLPILAHPHQPARLAR